MKKIYILTLLLSVMMTGYGQAQKSAPPTVVPYGSSITLAQAERMLAAAKQEALANGFTMAIAIVDTGGNLVAFFRKDNTQVGSIEVALGKARTANNFKRPSKAFEDIVAGGGAGLRILSLPGVVPAEGGEPIVYQGKIIGAIGVSGMTSGQDAQVAKAGLSTLN